MKRISAALLVAFGLFLLPAAAVAQKGTDTNTKGTINATAGTVSFGINGQCTVGISVTGTWSGSLAVKVAVDAVQTGIAGANFGVTTAVALTSGSVTNAITANGLYQVNVAGMSAVQIYGTNIASGTANISLVAGGGGCATIMADNPLPVTPTAGSPATFSGSITNPTSTLTMTSATTAYSAGQLIANNATAGSITNPSFSILNSAGGVVIPRVRLASNDTTSTAWAGVNIQVDLWTASPTWTSGDRGTWLPATGASSHIASYSCTMPTPVWGDGLATECSLSVGNFAAAKLASGTSIYWSLKAVGASGVTGASKVFTLTPELMN